MKYWLWDDVSPNLSSTGGPVDQSVSFNPDLGVPISRPRTTAVIENWSTPVTFLTRDQFAEFEAWFRDDLKQGILPFVWRHPSNDAVRSMRIIPATYQSSYSGGEWVQVSLNVMILPSTLWFAPYVPIGSSRVPDFVADYVAGRYWIGQTEVAATALATISGAYDVLTQPVTGDQAFTTVTYAGDVPQTAPSGVAWIAGFIDAP